MSEVAQTLEGWYALHDFRALDWQAWKGASESARREAIAEFNDLVKQWRDKENNNGGSTAIYNIVGHKADFLFMNLRPTMAELNEAEYAFNRTALADYTYRPYSYVSVVELSNYISASGGDPMEHPEIRARLFPVLPQTRHLCFYPMNKRRDGEDNWYMLDMDQRRTMMRSHSMIGRSYAGRVKQIISGSVGFDDWEWGVTLFSDDPITFKKLIYEMRFDEVSARYGDFGEFYVGNLLDDQQLNLILG